MAVNWKFYLFVLCVTGGIATKNHKGMNTRKSPMKGVFLNTWAVVVHGDVEMANKVAAENGFANKGKVFENVYEFIHPGIPKRKKRASLVKSVHLKSDTRVVFAQQQESKARSKRSINFNDAEWKNQWYLHHRDYAFSHHHMNVVPVWKKGYSGKGVVVSVLDDGLEHTHPEIAPNYDPKASYDYNDNDTDPLPRYNWREDNKHGTRCAGEIAAAGNNSFCVVGVAYKASIGGIRMLDGEITDLVEAQSLSHARDHVDIYSSSWGPEDDGVTVDEPGPLTKKALRDGARFGRQGKGSIVVWASGNGGGESDHCNCDGYTNSIYTVSVSAATSIGIRPWYLESCASTLVSAYSTGSTDFEKSIVTADLNGGCTDGHTGTSASQPLIAGFIALALEANPNLTWRDVQHILVESSSLEHLDGNDFTYNAAGKRFSHHFGYGIVNGEKLINLAEKWHTAPEQHVCFYQKEIKEYPDNQFNNTHALELDVNITACQGTPQYIRYAEHVQVKTTFFHYRRGATEILIISPQGTRSWVLKEREKDRRGKQFHEWKFLSTHFWGENPVGNWKVIFYSQETDKLKPGFLQLMTLIVYGTEHKPGERSKQIKPYRCHEQCIKGCSGPENTHCYKCKHHFFKKENKKFCVESCPSNMYLESGTAECIMCQKTCLTCNEKKCLSCQPGFALHNGQCLQACPKGMFIENSLVDKSVCHPCIKSCASCINQADKCTECGEGSILQDSTCVARCAGNQWLNGKGCELCHPSCKSCSGGASEHNCTFCPKIYLNDAENRYLHRGNQCVTSCPIRTFVENTIEQSCLDCPTNCLQCSNNGLKCEICDISYFRVAAGDGKCVKECPNGYYADLVRRVCEPCDLPCSKCVPGEPSACISCMDGFYLKDHECVSASECDTRYYVNKTTGACDSCPATCSFCESANLCTACFLNYYLTPDDKCVERCPNGTYALDRRTTCGNCASTCSECQGPTSHDCIACPVGRYLHNGKCVKKIPKGYYAENIGHTSICKPCHHTCSDCSGPHSADCLTCIEPLDKREIGCVNPCPDQWLSENKCAACHPSCQSCFGPNSNQCLLCSSNFSLNIDTHSCNKACPRKYFKDPRTFICKRCHGSCASCNGPKANQCLTCPEKLQFHNNTCVWQCPFGWYKTFGQECSRCSSRCKKCLYKYDLCTNCHEGYVWRDFKCFKTCGEKMFHDDSKRCYFCHASCLTCSGTSPNQCTSCEQDMTLHNDMCVRGCLPGFYNSTIHHKCMPCMKDCLKCQETATNQLQCNVCSNTTMLTPENACVKSCPVGTYRQPLDNKCGACSGKGCSSCDESTCLKCKPLYQKSNGLCKSTCGRGMYPDDKTSQCKKCHKNCMSCDGSSKRSCERCTDDALTLLRSNKKISCLNRCPNKFYKHKKLCKHCRLPCKTCLSKKVCTTCVSPFLTVNGTCLKKCPNGYVKHPIDNECVLCKRLVKGCTTCNESQCLHCKKGFALKDGKCVKECDENSVLNGNGICFMCNHVYKNCSTCNTTLCITCQPGYSLINATCGCAHGKQVVNGVCQDCKFGNCVAKLDDGNTPALVSPSLTLKVVEKGDNTHTNLEAVDFNSTSGAAINIVEPDVNSKKRSRRSVETADLHESSLNRKASATFFTKLVTVLACLFSFAFFVFITWRAKSIWRKVFTSKRSLIIPYNESADDWSAPKKSENYER